MNRNGFPKGLTVRPTPRLEPAMLEFFKELGIPASEWSDPGLDLANTPRRIAKMLRDEVLVSYKPGTLSHLRSSFTCFPSDGQNGMVLEGPIDFHSTCAHHLLPFSGEAFVAYIPGPKLVGASKLPRVVEHFARMLQLQERLGRQVADFIYETAQARVVIVLMHAAHLCMRCRGVKQQNTKMLTCTIRPQPGDVHDELIRPVLDEFYRQVAILKQ